MAKILDKHGVSHYLSEIIEESKEFIGIVSPYISTSAYVRAAIELSPAKKVFLFRRNDIKPAELKWISGLENSIMYCIQNLHSKCYVTERAAIISSMNLYDWSQIYNYEMGIYVEKDQDPDLYSSIIKEYKKLISVGLESCLERILYRHSNVNEKHRVGRLKDTAEIFSKRFGDVGIKELYDHKGELCIDWGQASQQPTQKKYMEDIWEYQGELSENVKHVPFDQTF